MHKDPFVLSQLVQFLNRSKFNRIVDKYDGDKYVKSYTCWDQLLTMMFGQLSNRESLRNLIVALEAHAGKVYHLGIGKSVSRSNLSKANEQRDYRIFEEFAFFMIAEARRRRIQKIFEFAGHVYAFDSTTIDLCLSVFEWAKFRKHKFLHSCILPRQKSTIQRLCLRFRMRTAPIISSTVATTISAISTPSTASVHSSSSGRKPMSASSLRLGNGGFLQMWFRMQSVTSRFIKAQRITRRNCGRWYASTRKTVQDTYS